MSVSTAASMKADSQTIEKLVADVRDPRANDADGFMLVWNSL